MSAGEIVLVIAIVVLVLGLLGWWLARRARARQRAELQNRFGPEYDRTVEGSDSRRRGESELSDRLRRHAKYELRPLSAESRERYSHDWNLAQARFVDDPRGAVAEADELVTGVMRERGYPTDEFDQQAADLSVEHAGTVERYRSGHAIADQAKDATTEQLRQAMQHYRAIFEEVLVVDPNETVRDRPA